MKNKISPVKSPSPKPSVQFQSSPMNSSPSVDIYSSDPFEFKNSRSYHPKRVVTPDWIKEDQTDPDTDTPIKLVDQEKIADIHFELEVLERRIEDCVDTKHGHPALCVTVREEEGVSDITRKEKKLRNNYTFIPPVNVVPGFWTKRIYDKPENLLSKEESEALQIKIQESTSSTRNHSPMITRMHSWNSDYHTPSPFFSYADDDNEFDSDIEDYNLMEDYSPHKKNHKKKSSSVSRTSSSNSCHPTVALAPDGAVVPKRKRGRPRKYPLPDELLSISLLNYATDDSDDKTDWDDELL